MASVLYEALCDLARARDEVLALDQAERAAAIAANDAAMRIEDEFQSYARNSLMAAHFPALLDAERAARRVSPQITEAPK